MAKVQPFRLEAAYTPVSNRAGSRSQKSRPLTISDQGATLRVTTLIRTGFDANASTVPILIPGMVTGAPVSVA